jgi:hypothetical protein
MLGMVAMLQPIMGIRNRIAWRTQGGLGWTLKRSRCRETPKSKRRTEVIRRWMEDADPGGADHCHARSSQGIEIDKKLGADTGCVSSWR